MTIAIIIILIIMIVLFNQIIREENATKNAFSTVDVLLRKRYDLIPNLIEVVKGHASHEKEVFENIADIRNKVINSQDKEFLVKTDGEMNSALKELLMVAEEYPNLKTNESFLELQKNLLLIEDELSAARRTYNAAVTEYNITLESFPTNIVAKIMNKKHKILFSVTDDVKNAINLKNI